MWLRLIAIAIRTNFILERRIQSDSSFLSILDVVYYLTICDQRL